MVAVWDKQRINPIAIGHIEVAMPEADQVPQRVKGLSTVIANDPP